MKKHFSADALQDLCRVSMLKLSKEEQVQAKAYIEEKLSGYDEALATCGMSSGDGLEDTQDFLQVEDLREDRVERKFTRGQMLQNAPALHKDMVVVPRSI